MPHEGRTFTESVVEDAALDWLGALGYAPKNGADIAPDGAAPERGDFGEVVLAARLRDALACLNPALPAEARDEAFRKLTRPEGANLVAVNRNLHRMLVDGVTVEYRRPDGGIAGAQARVLDFDDPDANDWLAVNQFTVIENKHNRRPDIVLFVNGLPLGIVELKNPADEQADVWAAFKQLQTYKAEIPALLGYNAVLVISDGVSARLGTLTADRERFAPWRTIEGADLADKTMPELEVVLSGALHRRRFLDLVRHFIVFEDTGGGSVAKKMAGYHQFHAVNVALEETLRAARKATGVAAPLKGYGAQRQPGGAEGDSASA